MECLPCRITGCIAEYDRFEFCSLPVILKIPLGSRNGQRLDSELSDGRTTLEARAAISEAKQSCEWESQ